MSQMSEKYIIKFVKFLALPYTGRFSTMKKASNSAGRIQLARDGATARHDDDVVDARRRRRRHRPRVDSHSHSHSHSKSKSKSKSKPTHARVAARRRRFRVSHVGRERAPLEREIKPNPVVVVVEHTRLVSFQLWPHHRNDGRASRRR